MLHKSDIWRPSVNLSLSQIVDSVKEQLFSPAFSRYLIGQPFIRELYRKNISLDKYLKSLNMEQEYKNIEDILKEEKYQNTS